MQIDIITVVPDLLQSPFQHSIMKRAADKGLLNVNVINLRNYGLGKSKQVDDKAFGGEAGMVMMIEPIANCINDLKTKKKYDEVIYMTPDGKTFNQKMANHLSLKENLIILCGHYKGIDERLREHFITMEISIGDYVLSGGELAAAMVVDALGRLIPGVLNDESSALFDSFQDDLLSYPIYTRPAEYNGWKVPPVLLSGDPKIINQWKEEQSLKRTEERRPDLLK